MPKETCQLFILECFKGYTEAHICQNRGLLKKKNIFDVIRKV